MAVRAKVGLRAPPGAWGNEPASFISCSLPACQAHLGLFYFYFLLLQEDGRGLWGMFGASDIAIL